MCLIQSKFPETMFLSAILSKSVTADKSLDQKMLYGFEWKHKPAHNYRAAPGTSVITLSLLLFTHYHLQCKINMHGKTINE